MKRYYLTTVAVSLAVLLCFSFIYDVWHGADADPVLRVGFIYENDESTPYTYNFFIAQDALEKQYRDQVRVMTRSNVMADETDGPLRELVKHGCRIVFINSYSEQVLPVAREFPDVQFCQVSFAGAFSQDRPANYHTFNGEIYQGRYVSGVVAGMKLRQLIDGGDLAPEEALVGFVGAFPSAEVISGYTAFLLGVRAAAPEAVMRVRYTGTWSSYTQEKACAKKLIDEGCVIIAQHTDTIGPAVACEEASADRKVYHIGYHQSMIDVAPNSSLITAHVDWTPYLTGAVAAVLAGRPIESVVAGTVHGTDLSAGFDKGWVEMLDLNAPIAAEGTQDKVNQLIEAFQKGRQEVFQGDYVGVDRDNPSDTCDLSQGYTENKDSSTATFHYVLRDVITEE